MTEKIGSGMIGEGIKLETLLPMPLPIFPLTLPAPSEVLAEGKIEHAPHPPPTLTSWNSY
jgi:hypothetical protein